MLALDQDEHFIGREIHHHFIGRDQRAHVLTDRVAVGEPVNILLRAAAFDLVIADEF